MLSSISKGIIYRIIEDEIFVATRDGGILFGQVFGEEGSETINKTLRLGDRFYTPTTVLDDSKRERVFYSPNGLRN